MITSGRIDEALLRLREFFREHAGCPISTAQAARVAELDRDTCEAILGALVYVRFIQRCGDAYVRAADSIPERSARSRRPAP
jgi:hypothetical protein